jgi:hypothetical protein
MNHGPPPPPLLVVIILIILVIVFFRSKTGTYKPEEVRLKELAALAKKLGLHFNPLSDFKLLEKFSFISWLRRGDPNIRYAQNILYGHYQNYSITVFDYIFGTGFHWSAFVLEMNTNFPDVLISHESKESRIAETFGSQQIAFESSEFSRTFRVRASDRKFAFDVCHAQMMEYLLANQDLTIEVSGSIVAILFEDWLHPKKIESNLSRLIEIRKLLPHYLFTNT